MPEWVLILTTAGVTAALLTAARALTTREKKIDHRIDHRYKVGDEQFARSIGSLLEPALQAGNTIDVYNNGDEIFPPMLDAIASARRSVTLETFIYWSGSIGRRFADALCERSRAGVQVHVILDWFGSSKIDQSILNDMERAGVELERHRPVHWYTLRKFNNRTHRKILVVDGLVGFTGGVGIADNWLGDARRPDEWRDTHFRIRGPGVAQLQCAFMDNWLKSHSSVLHDENYFPPLEPAGDTAVQVFKSSPSEGSESARLMFLLSIASAAESIRIGTAYFVPDSLTVSTLIEARERGVRVTILVPGEHIDKQVVRRASRARWGELLEAGVEIHEYEPTMYHCKVMVVDDRWVTIGSANIDNRSFRLNEEMNLNTLDAELARRLAADFDADLERSRRITLEQWKNRPAHEKAREHLAALFRPQL